VANPLAITLHAFGSVSASADGAAVDCGAIRTPGAIQLQLNITAVSGTLPTLKIYLETAPTSTGTWRQFGEYDGFNRVTSEELTTFGPSDRHVRARWALGGTLPDFTFSLTGYAHQLYCVPRDIARLSLAGPALSNLSEADQCDACLRASGDTETLIAAGYTLPVTAWSDDVRGRAADIAAFYALSTRGFSPNGIDEMLVKRFDDAQSWLRMVGTGKIQPPGLVDSTPTIHEAASHVVVSAARRGW
jgi:phage gp36-like protein